MTEHPSPISPEQVARLRELLAKATPGQWRVGRQQGAPRDHLVDMGEPPSAPYFRMHKGLPKSGACAGSPAFGIVESDDASAEEIAANAALIAAMKNALPALLDQIEGLREALSRQSKREKRLRALVEANFGTLEEQERRMMRWGKSHHELARAISETRAALKGPSNDAS